MDLAQASSIFKESKNQKALGICYNNIANIQYKNAQYHEAANNFSKAIQCVEILVRDLNQLVERAKAQKRRRFDEKIQGYNVELGYYKRVKAHRQY